MKNSYLTATDQFCGAGGSGQGAIKAGVEVKQALNHWKLATESYSANFPNTMVDCTDISACDPRRYMPTNILITSPECTVHSPAGGNHYKSLKKQMDLFEQGKIDPAAERSRATMWDVCRFAEYHGYELIIVENVVEAKTRWPLFDVWLKAMHTLGYRHRLCFINSQHCHPTPQSRDRMYVVFWKKGNPAPNLDFTPISWCSACEKDVHAYQWWKDSSRKYGKYGERNQYLYRCPGCTQVVEPYYYASFNIIDWSIPGISVLDRPKPLADNTMRRIEYGLEKFGHQHLIIGHYYTGNQGTNVKPMSSPLPTQTGHSGHAIVSPYYITTAHSQTKDWSAVRSGVLASRAVTTADSTGVVFPFSPFVVENNGQSKARAIDQPYPSQTSEPKHGIITPGNVNAFLSYYYGNSTQYSQMHDATYTISTRDRVGLITHKKPTLEECSYRTIRPHEVKKAMAFGHDYILHGSGRNQVRQLGNAVTPPVMEWLVERCVKSLS